MEKIYFDRKFPIKIIKQNPTTKYDKKLLNKIKTIINKIKKEKEISTF